MNRRPVPAVSALIEREGKILLIRRGREPNKGRWSLPGGSIQPGETMRQALIREVREETGLRIEPGEIIAVRDIILRDLNRVRFHYIVVTFRAEVTGGELAAGSDAEEAEWKSLPIDDKLPITEHLRELVSSLRPASFGQSPPGAA